MCHKNYKKTVDLMTKTYDNRHGLELKMNG